MTRLDKIKKANDSLQEMTLNNDLAFFTRLLPQKMEDFLKLTYFDIDHTGFQNYLKEYREHLVLSAINWCKDSKLNETQWQKEYTLKTCKRSIDDFIPILKMAFDYYLGSTELLLKDEAV